MRRHQWEPLCLESEVQCDSTTALLVFTKRQSLETKPLRLESEALRLLTNALPKTIELH